MNETNLNEDQINEAVAFWFPVVTNFVGIVVTSFLVLLFIISFVTLFALFIIFVQRIKNVLHYRQH